MYGATAQSTALNAHIDPQWLHACGVVTADPAGEEIRLIGVVRFAGVVGQPPGSGPANRETSVGRCGWSRCASCRHTYADTVSLCLQ